MTVPYLLKLMAVPIVAFVISGVTGYFLIPFLKKIHFGQTILKYVDWHKDKQGTPIMGGFMFILGTFAAAALGYFLICFGQGNNNALYRLLICAGYALLCGGIGFADDYIKAVKKQNLGLNSKQKLAMQFTLTAVFLFLGYLTGDTTVINFYFFKLDIWLFYYPLMLVYMVYMVNAVNLTDGVDGLCGSVTVVSASSIAVIALLMQEQELGIYSIALGGALLGFLIWNIHPAKVFMGDTGSMFLGGSVVALMMLLKSPVLLFIVGIVYFCEAFSVVLQVASFKLTGKRIFKMSPIHHHFEMCGWNENKIVIVFSATGLLAGIGSILIVYNEILVNL